MKTCSKSEVVAFLPSVAEYNLNQVEYKARFHPKSSGGARAADEGREFSGVNITLFPTGWSTPSTTDWFPNSTPFGSQRMRKKVLGTF